MELFVEFELCGCSLIELLPLCWDFNEMQRIYVIIEQSGAYSVELLLEFSAVLLPDGMHFSNYLFMSKMVL